jgi:putative PIN family toxin of toxin-antitoxin system
VRVVIDTNVLLAAFTTHGLCESVVDVCFDSHDVIACDHILFEVERNLRVKFKMPATEAAEFVQFLREEAEIVDAPPAPEGSCPDKDDLPILGAAVAAAADCIVTGDKDLLRLKQFSRIPIHSPRAFYELLRP